MHMKRRLLWIIEVFIWLLILFLVSSTIIFAKYNYKKNFNTYQIFLHDVDGLIVGSPVKLMGIQIGYVNQLDIVGEDIYVKFIITETDVKIPYGSTATVEFSGLGGSKSLELYPPSSNYKECCKIIVPQPPKRIHDSLGLLSNMFDSVMNIEYDISNFMEKMGIVGKKKLTDKGSINKNQEKGKIESKVSCGDFLSNCNCWLDKLQKRCDKFNEKVKNKEVGKNGNDKGKNQPKDFKSN